MTETEKPLGSGKREDSNKEQKIVLFGILAGTKALLNPVKENLEISKQGLEILKGIESSLQMISVSQKAIAENLLRTARALTDLNYKFKG